MHAILLTIFVSLVLVVLFVVLFLRERTSRDTISSAERDALLPFDDGDRVDHGESVAPVRKESAAEAVSGNHKD